MSTKRIRHTAKFKFQIVLEATTSDETINQLASDRQVNPSQISQWKKQLLEQESSVFSTAPNLRQRERDDRESNLYEQGTYTVMHLVLRAIPRIRPFAFSSCSFIGNL